MALFTEYKKKVIESTDWYEDEDGFKIPRLLSSNATIYQPQQLKSISIHQIPIAKTQHALPTICYICRAAVTNNLDGYYQLTGCKVGHAEDCQPMTMFNVVHAECYPMYMQKARKGEAQCNICNSLIVSPAAQAKLQAPFFYDASNSL